MDGPCARRSKRVQACTVVRVHTIPLLPEDLFQALADSFDNLFPLGCRDGMNSSPHPSAKCAISFSVNAEVKAFSFYPMKDLLDVLRNDLD